ncbi:TIGR03943 family protein [Catellatospora sp. KI3]|uniref:TIGR03943 family putative permease subunit n=1 Tax=Catellatospora sp. KI3 TaxID=3041620 RepID=UPI002482111D|nr:TIGR03943 family protein [Catellatospora sp. KI3]MDI1465568.1 TIGR03943 family protein [Catellatospora sp. KI3]
MNRQAQGVVMLLLGGAILKASLTDMYLRYVKAGLQPFLIGAGLLLVLAAIMTIWYDLRHGATVDTECADDHDHAGHSGGGHGHREPRIGWLLIAPVLGLLLVAPPALGSYAAGQAGTALSAQQTTDFPPLPDGDPVQLSVLDYATRAIFDSGASLGERTVQLTGFISLGPDGQPLLTRMILSCCAADARPIKVALTGSAPEGVAPDTWLEVTGTYSTQTLADPVNGEDIPFLNVATWRPVPAPKEQYE